MKKQNKRPRKTMWARNRSRVNRLRKQQTIIMLTPVFILVLIKLGLEELTNPVKMKERLMLHISKLTGNPYFVTPGPSVAELQALVTELDNTITAIDGGNKALIAYRDALMLEAEYMIRQLSYYVQNISKGDLVKIESAGFKGRKGKGPSQPVTQVMHLVVTVLGNGKLKLRWKRIGNSDQNYIQTTDNPVTGTWSHVGKTKRSSFILEGLTPGQVYFIRVYASNGLGDGLPSDSSEQRVL